MATLNSILETLRSLYDDAHVSHEIGETANWDMKTRILYDHLPHSASRDENDYQPACDEV